jgi:hypothetical protein
MLLDDTLLMKGDEDMTDKKDDKSPEDDSLFGNSGELFETLFTKGQKEKAAPKSGKKAGAAAKIRKSVPQSNPAKPRKADPQSKTKKIAKERPISRVHVDRPKRVSTKAAAKTSKVVEKRPVSADQGDAPEEVRPQKRAKFRKIKSDKIGSQPKIGGGSDKIKIAVLSVILVAAVAFIVHSLGPGLLRAGQERKNKAPCGKKATRQD